MITIKKIYLYVFDTMADWEPALLIAELRLGRYFKDRTLKYEVATVSLTLNPVTTMGGVKILPDMTLAELSAEDVALLILPGGNTWLEPFHAPVFPVVRELLERSIPVAAICGATIGLGANGLLDRHKHTSNDLGFLKACCPTYAGEAMYVNKPAVCDGPLITASGVAPLEFAYETLKKLDLFAPATLDAWYRLFSTHEPEHFYALMGSLPVTS
ncbi:type 1 glutamine amidotransferase family protein [Methanocella arvoryzae]|uniref:Intracellular protease (ThiJ/PfpI family) n=1 Tax=Methanocella arvoryzae (strain DSM 22066 / NBRC 105507 / MRE50) TaxID=351160 RepID=Q0W2S2_METAR|nr:type 1 glutamine amidotransferase family protein [Methanocella arvoryzae]CAJ37321.1 putative intracellular protease (ThiJ/PfpI family) [Methanocella arvoryzae MRE50]